MPVLRRWSIDEYEQMIAAGILDEDEHVELIEGEIVCMAAMGTPHVAVQTLGRDDGIAALAFPDLLLPLAEILR